MDKQETPPSKPQDWSEDDLSDSELDAITGGRNPHPYPGPPFGGGGGMPMPLWNEPVPFPPPPPPPPERGEH